MAIEDDPYRETRNKNKNDVRRVIKKTAVDYKGGQCHYCGYDRCISALEFHHIDPSTKLFAISRFSRGRLKDWSELYTELDKTILVCANCHREIEDGIINVELDGNTGGVLKLAA